MFFESRNANMKFNYPFLCALRARALEFPFLTIKACIHQNIRFLVNKFNYEAEMVVSECVWQKINSLQCYR